jgi:hypothetical protein
MAFTRDILMSRYHDVKGVAWMRRRAFVYGGVVARSVIRRLKVTLDAEHAAKLARLAERMNTEERTLACLSLAHALDAADPKPRGAGLLDAIPGAYERALLGRAQSSSGQTIPFADL